MESFLITKIVKVNMPQHPLCSLRSVCWKKGLQPDHRCRCCEANTLKMRVCPWEGRVCWQQHPLGSLCSLCKISILPGRSTASAGVGILETVRGFIPGMRERKQLQILHRKSHKDRTLLPWIETRDCSNQQKKPVPIFHLEWVLSEWCYFTAELAEVSSFALLRTEN